MTDTCSCLKLSQNANTVRIIHCFLTNVTQWRDKPLNSNVACARTYKIYMQCGWKDWCQIIDRPPQGTVSDVLESTQTIILQKPVEAIILEIYKFKL